MTEKKISIVYDWLTTLGGGEHVLESVLHMFPGEIYTLFFQKKTFQNTPIEKAKVHTSFLQKMLFRKQKHQKLFPLFPLAIEQFDLSSSDVILSISHSCAKGILTKKDQLHICYCFTPMRYAWDLYHEYLNDFLRKKPIRRLFATLALHYLRLWDQTTSSRVDVFIAISHYVASRIENTYQRKSVVIYPPVDTEFFSYKEGSEDFYVSASRFVPYKKMDLLAEAFRDLPEKKLLLIGEGPERKKIQRKASKNVIFLGRVERETLRKYLQKAKAFLFAATEDFGIAPVEAMSCGTPVIAYKKGGALETVIDGKTGCFFSEPTVDSLQKTIKEFESKIFDRKAIREHAKKFSKERFEKEFSSYVKSCMENFSKKGSYS